MHLVSNLPLQEMAARRAVINLWIEKDILDEIQNTRPFVLYTWEERFEPQVKNKLAKLKLPNLLKNQMISLVRPIGSDILRWEKTHKNIDIKILKQPLWTCAGGIDYPKMAEKCIQLRMLTPVKRYKLATLYCLEKYIPVLWKALAKKTRSTFESVTAKNVIRSMSLEHIWPYILNKKVYVLDKATREHLGVVNGMSFNKYAVKTFACEGNKAALEYFFQQLTTEEQKASIMTTYTSVITSHYEAWTIPRSFEEGRFGDVIQFLLIRMNPEQQMKVLKEYYFYILYWFLDWPWHNLFLDSADVILSFLPQTEYINFLRIARNHGFYFSDIFQKLFLNGPNELKNVFLSCEFPFCLFEDFLRYEDIGSIKVVLKNIRPYNRLTPVSSYNFCEILHQVMIDGNFKFAQLCYRVAIKFKEDKESVIQRFMELPQIKSRLNQEQRQQMWTQFFQVLGEIIPSKVIPNKRCLEDEIVIQVKKISSQR